MNRREFLPTIALLSTPKISKESIHSNFSGLHLGMLTHLFSGTFRLEMSEAQNQAFTELKIICGVDSKDAGFTAGMLHMIPTSINSKVPNDEVWLVAFDGTVMSKIVKLAIPIGYER